MLARQRCERDRKRWKVSNCNKIADLLIGSVMKSINDSKWAFKFEIIFDELFVLNKQRWEMQCVCNKIKSIMCKHSSTSCSPMEYCSRTKTQIQNLYQKTNEKATNDINNACIIARTCLNRLCFPFVWHFYRCKWTSVCI